MSCRPFLIKRIELRMPNYSGEADVYVTAYQTDLSPAIMVCDVFQEPLYTATSWIGHDGIKPAPRCAFIKDYSENRGILVELIKHGLLEPTGKVVKTEFVQFPEAKLLLTDAQWEEFDARFPKPN